jgi:hypothetical protein
MHRTEGANYAEVGGKKEFTDGPPGTTVEEDWLNAVQKELVTVIEDAGLTLKTASTETGVQLLAALDAMYARNAGLDYVGFSVNKNNSGDQSIAASTSTKITFDGANAEWDTEGDFDDANNRYTPSVAGKYLFTGHIHISAQTDQATLYVRIRKNGADVKGLSYLFASGAEVSGIGGSCEIDMNGTTDYVEVWIWENSGGGNKNVDDAPVTTYFQGHLIK